MTTSVASRNQTLVVTEVSKIQVTPVTEGDNIQLRAIRIWGSDGDNAPPVLEIIISAETAEDLKITTPELSF
jgi:hypothetical protein